MKHTRSSGILLHPTSLPGPYGIGDIGPEAWRFVDFLAEAGQQIWQVLPLGPTGYGDSPYQSFSSLAGNPLLISPEQLMRDGFLGKADLDDKPDFPANKADFGAVIAWKHQLLRKAYENAIHGGSDEEHGALATFCHDNAHWLDDCALFMAIKETHNYAVWTEWEPDLAFRSQDAMEGARREHANAIGAIKFAQYIFFKQWSALRAHCAEQGVTLLGDIPIYVAHDSSDVWANRHMFQLDQHGNPTVVAGVPPDYFCDTGQLWGNPIYRWDYLADTGYAWWVERLRAVLRMVDLVRLDHFRGFEAYWEVPASDETAVNGRWVPGPREWIFDTFKYYFGEELPLLAEDLGFITPEVHALRERFGLSGMAVLQFGFGENAHDSAFPPHTYQQNLAAYTGTHDNDTTLGWWKSLQDDPESAGMRAYIQAYLDTNGQEFNWICIRALMASVAKIVVFPLQDILGIGSEGRMNYPGHANGNWTWRFLDGDIKPEIAARLHMLTELFGRTLPPPIEESAKEAENNAAECL